MFLHAEHYFYVVEMLKLVSSLKYNSTARDELTAQTHNWVENLSVA